MFVLMLAVVRRDIGP